MNREPVWAEQFVSPSELMMRLSAAAVLLLRSVSVLIFIGTFALCVQLAQAQLPTTIGWTALPATTSLEGSGACLPDYFEGDSFQFNYYCGNVIKAWSGAVADTVGNRLIIWGGGHNNYYGNEIYALNLTANPVTLTRLNDPTIPTNSANRTNCIEAIPPGVGNAPNSRESYGGMAFFPEFDIFFVTSGSLACLSGGGSHGTWTISLANVSNSTPWQNADIGLTGPGPGSDGGGTYGNVAEYDPNSGLAFVADAGAIYTYNYQTNTYNRITPPFGFTTSIYLSGAIDPTRKLFVLVGGCSGGTCPLGSGVFVADISDPTSTTQQDWTAATLADPNCAEFLSGGVNPIGTGNPGITFDSVANDFVGWPNQGNSVYIMTPDPVNHRLTCQKQTFANGPPNSAQGEGPNTTWGTYGRFRYFPALDLFVLVNDSDIPAYILLLRGPTDFTVSATPSTVTVSPGGTATYTVNVGALNGFTGTVSLAAAGLPTGATASFSPSSVTTPGSSTLTVTTRPGSSASSSTVTITGTSGTLANSANVTLNVAVPDFTLSATPSTVSVSPGGTATYTVNVAALNGFTGTVSLAATGLPTGALPSFAPTSITTSGSSTLTITTMASTPMGSPTLTITGTSGSLVHTTTVTLTVGTIISISSVQAVANSVSGSASSLSLSFPSSTMAGDVILVAFDYDTNATASSVTDSQGNVFTAIGNQLTSPGGARSRVYSAKNIKGGTDTVTVNLSANSGYIELYLTEYTGVDQTNPIDAQAGASGSAGSVSSGNATTTVAGDVIYGYCVGDAACTVGSGFAARSTFQNNLIEDQLAGNGGTYAATASANNGWTMQMVALKPASSTLGGVPVITSATTASGMVGSAFSYQITATNTPTSYGATGLPAGLSVNSITGLISGTPTAAGTSTVTLSATNSSGTGNATLTLTIAIAAPVITSATTASGMVGSAFSYQITATNTPTSYGVTGLPAGLSVSSTTGLISGTPTAAGTSKVTLSATNSSGTGNATLTLTVGTIISISSVQAVANSVSGSASSLSLSFPSSTMAGDIILVAFDYDTNATASSVTDSQGNVFTAIGNQLTSPGGARSRVYSAKNIKGGTDTVTVNLSANSGYIELYLTEYTGVDQTNPIDAQAGASGSAGSVSSGNASTTVAGDVIYGYCVGDWSCTVGSGFAARSTLNSNLIEDQLAGNGGTYAATASANNGWTMQMVALKPRTN
jgi:hypothetical protein